MLSFRKGPLPHGDDRVRIIMTIYDEKSKLIKKSRPTVCLDERFFEKSIKKKISI